MHRTYTHTHTPTKSKKHTAAFYPQHYRSSGGPASCVCVISCVCDMLDSSDTSSPSGNTMPRHSFFSWLMLRGKRTRLSDADSSTRQNNSGRPGSNNENKRRNSPPPCAASTESARLWDRALPVAADSSIMTAPVSTCSGSTMSRAASWSEATFGSEASGVLVRGRLQSSATAAEPQEHDESPQQQRPPSIAVLPASCEAARDNKEMPVTGGTTTKPIDIPCHSDEEEPADSALHEV